MHILVVEDDRRTAQLLTELLRAEQHQVDWTETGEDALLHLQSASVDLVVLDVMLPGRDGLSICKEIRSFSSVRILMLSARGAPMDRVDGLRMGADDYLPKPFHAQEFLARVEALSRRGGSPTDARPTSTLHIRELRLNVHARTVHCGTQPIHLTGAEFDILRVLMERAGQVVARERLMVLARGPEFRAFDRAIDVHISNIRRKLGDSPRSPTWIRTIRGVGYHMPLCRDET